MGRRYCRRSCPTCLCCCQPVAGMALPDLYRGRLCRCYRTSVPVCSAFVDWWIPAGTARQSRVYRSSLDWRCSRSRGCDPCYGPLDNQSAGRSRCFAFQVANPVLRMGRDSHVGGLCGCTFGCSSGKTALTPTSMARQPYFLRLDNCHWVCGSRHSNRGNDGSVLESLLMCIGIDCDD